jgi:hypothetical protein
MEVIKERRLDIRKDKDVGLRVVQISRNSATQKREQRYVRLLAIKAYKGRRQGCLINKLLVQILI